MISRVKGTQDFLDLRLFNYLIKQFAAHAQNYHFNEISLPILEHTELFKRSLGVTTDVVSKEMYTVNTGHESSESICLRPEATAQTMRSYLEHSHTLSSPWRTFLAGSMFRHERPQKGRFREFHQISCEVIGSAAIDEDIWLITMLDRFFQEKLKLREFALQINFLGCAQDRAAHKKALVEFLDKNLDAICSDCKERKDKNTLRIFDCKTPSCQVLYKNAPTIDAYLCTNCVSEWKHVQDSLQQLSVAYSINTRLVRGLDYYTKTVFEFISLELGAQSTFCGGGRYDGLAEILGGPATPAIGAAMGIERLMLILEKHQDTLTLPELPALHAIIPMDQAQRALALLLADELAAAGLCVELCLGDSMKSMLRKANKLGANYALILGSEEQQAHTVTIKNMTTGEEAKISQREAVKYLKK
jgi:histidyl-tRNA synthetase